MLKPGREADAEIAEKVMGWHVERRQWANGGEEWQAWTDWDEARPGDSGALYRICAPIGAGAKVTFNPSVKIRDAFKVVDHLWKEHRLVVMLGGQDDYWWCEFFHKGSEKVIASELAADPAEAICRAALKAVSAEAARTLAASEGGAH